jgi:adenine-specific DNA methylase
MPTSEKRLEAALPLEMINCEAARAESIREGNSRALPLAWARQPLSARRARKGTA